MDVAEIIDSIDMTEYIGQYCELEVRGRELWALSPFKQENTPSFSLDPEKKFWYDFSSGTGGNLIDFVMRYHNVDLYHAVGLLKKYANITDNASMPVTRLNAARIARKFRATEKPIKESSGHVLSDDVMDRYYFDREKLRLWADEGIQYDVMKRFGVRYDYMDNRIVYPIRDYDGRIVSVSGRTCEPDYKAKGIRKYTYFNSIGTIDTLCGFSDNREFILAQREIILFEGAKSVLLAYGWGIRNTAAVLTSHLSLQQFRFLLRLGNLDGVRIVFALDSDVDITKDDNIRALAMYAQVEWVRNANGALADKESPADRGEEIFRLLYNGRQPLRQIIQHNTGENVRSDSSQVYWDARAGR